jgi:hypothetical protein
MVTIMLLVGITAHIIMYIPITFVVNTTIIVITSMTVDTILLVGIIRPIIMYIPITLQILITNST